MQQASLLEMNAASLILLRSLGARSKLKLYQGRNRYLIRLQLKVNEYHKVIHFIRSRLLM